METYELREARISVVIPVYNEKAFLESVVRKILLYEVDEVFIVDDGSTDGSSHIIERLMKFNSKVKCLRLEENSGGCGVPRELGVLSTDGEYVAFCDSDITNINQVDYDEILKATRDPSVDLIIGNYTGKTGRITNFVAKPMLRLFFPEININRVKTGQLCASKKLLEHFLKSTRFSHWNSTISLLIFAYMNSYKVIEVDIGELHHNMKLDTELIQQQAESTIRLILTWARFYDRTGFISNLTLPYSRRHDELFPLIKL
jgi:glycosyltransferase involved in cell wall biosynthesis